jgi:hypothetical protein
MSFPSPVATSSQTLKLSRPPRLTILPTLQRPLGVLVWWASSSRSGTAKQRSEPTQARRSALAIAAVITSSVNSTSAMALPTNSDAKRLDADLRCHQPDQTPGQPFIERPAVELLPFRGIERHDLTRLVDRPPAIPAAGGDRRAQRILQGAAFECRIDSGVRNRAREIPRQDRTIV